MATKNGSIAPKERINIRYVPATGDQHQEVELPLKLLVTGDFKGHGEDISVEERTSVRIDQDTFDDVMAKSGLNLKMEVPATLDSGSESDTLSVDLQFLSMKDFGPDAIARQVPELNKLLELREALVALKGPMGNIPAFRKQIQALLGDESARSKLAMELEQLLESPEA
ncbi:type VI secretion system contractile sheath small subunit [Pseudomonas sp. R5(2019)]|uniref:type VI secretion system contractile sheath small subunit n=1 Tax=Pseudomonas sp. R5(2019) TaxID=2697566 RepID=UPI001411C056|nr:type VI secretion system contractile sheath small subunit [Pseudomonas sp. R5(2019)]NBA94154.1 type VI secretion system contractile sheath small subunit [Pseudomonas sp. R5(2019)]